MRIKPVQRILAERLRIEEGLSYNEISTITGIRKSTLSGWLKDLPLTEEQKIKLPKKMEANRNTFAQRAWFVNKARYEEVRNRAKQAGRVILDELPKLCSVDELSLAMLYLGEGSKSYGRVQIASIQPDILLYFLTMLRKLFEIDESRLSFRLNMINAARLHEDVYKLWWKTQLNFPDARFLKSQYDTRSQTDRITEGYHGVCTLTYHDTYLQQRLISLANLYISRILGEDM